jgi:hypothetical protein
MTLATPEALAKRLRNGGQSFAVAEKALAAAKTEQAKVRVEGQKQKPPR